MSFFRRSSRGGAPQSKSAFFGVLTLFFGFVTPSFAQESEGRLEGLWSSGCVEHRQRTLQFLKGELTDIIEIFSDTECRKKLGTLARISAYDLRPSAQSGFVPEAITRDLDLWVRSFSWTPEHPRYVAAFNAVSECGIQDWALGSSRTILGLRQDCYFLEGHSVYPAQPMKVPEPGDRLLELVRFVNHPEGGMKALDQKLNRATKKALGLQISIDFGNEMHRDSRAEQISPVLYQQQ